MKIFITGIAGFIGYHTAMRLIEDGHEVSGFDNFTPYYDVNLKKARYRRIKRASFDVKKADLVISLGAQPGVLFSRDDPESYIVFNVLSFTHLLQECRQYNIPLIYASSSTAEDPRSVYGVTKACDEMLAKVYRENYDMKILGLRFFGVYGPWGRPDMAIWKWTERIMDTGEAVFIRGKNTMRDFTYVDDLVDNIQAIVNNLRWDIDEVINIGRGRPRRLDEVIDVIEGAVGEKAKRIYTELEPEEEEITDSGGQMGCETDIEEGIPKFVEWYKGIRRS